MTPKFLSFLGKKWKFVRVSVKDKDFKCGKCDSPTKSNKQIQINEKLRGKIELDTILHEGLHACFWNIDEDYVEDAATDLANALWRIGYRKVK